MKDLIIEKLFFNNAHMGCLNSLKNSSCQSYLYPKYNKHSLIDLEQTCMSILKALKFLKALCLMNRNILFVATGEVSSDVVLSYCSENNIPFVSSR
ncbi:30S ribosomal protein S2 [Candidatus Pinguicoccus supinus]|uniref:30S ribosomal protein S2 n=1 Tax=Candidatus Pinguicoccus supinus TaxID=2529394 RepID=A0A7T0BSB4_9BACT|nr:30S ribosomal protein S2 [Candidatus Pinguicoccus supinus]